MFENTCDKLLAWGLLIIGFIISWNGEEEIFRNMFVMGIFICSISITATVVDNKSWLIKYETIIFRLVESATEQGTWINNTEINELWRELQRTSVVLADRGIQNPMESSIRAFIGYEYDIFSLESMVKKFMYR